ncbi:MAG: ABC transporter ATP-binding protein, partial [Nitrospinota bacterium]
MTHDPQASSDRPRHISRTNLKAIASYYSRYRLAVAVGLAALLATNACIMAVPWLLKWAIEAIGAGASMVAVGRLAALIVAVALLGGAFRVTSRVVIYWAGRRVEYDIRNDLFGHLLELPPSFYDRTRVGDILSRAINDTSNIRMLIGPGILQVTNAAIAYIAAITMMGLLSPTLTLCALAPYPLMFLFAKRYTSRLYDLSTRIQEALAAISTRVQETVSGIAVVQAYVQERSTQAAFEADCDAYYQRSIEMVRARGVIYPLLGAIASLATLIVLGVGGREVILGRLTLGDFVAFNGYLGLLLWPTIALGWILTVIQRGLAALTRTRAILATPNEAADGPEAQAMPTPAGRIEIRGLTFAYNGAARPADDGQPAPAGPALTEVSFTIEPGTTCAIVGRTGCGKSTLVRLLARLYRPPDGTVFIDGVDVNRLRLAELRARMGYVPQESFLFSTTIAENIAFGRPDTPAHQIERLSEVVSFSEEVAAFPAGLESVVGERGITLSG